MKILHINFAGVLGGAERMGFLLAKHQRKLGHETWLAYCKSGENFGSKAEEEGIPVMEFGMNNGFDVVNTIRFSKWVKGENFDIVHEHNAAPLTQLVKLIFSDVALIKHIHGVGKGWSRSKKYRRHAWDRVSIKLVDYFIANSNSTKDYMVSRRGFPSDKITVIPNAIELDDLQKTKSKTPASKCGLPEGKFIVGTLARFVREKGIDIFIDVAKRVLKERNDVVFLLAGYGPLEKQLKDKVSEYGLENKIIFPGKIENIANFYSHLDLFVMTSRWEGFGITLIEAMACGVPVIAFSVDGPKEVIGRDGGILIPPGERELMAKEIIRLLDDKNQRERMAKLGLQRAKHFDIRIIAENVLDLYDTIQI